MGSIVSHAIFLAVRRGMIACIDASFESEVILDELEEIFQRTAIGEIRFVFHHALESVQEIGEFGYIVIIFVFEILIDILDDEFLSGAQDAIALFGGHRECSGESEDSEIRTYGSVVFVAGN